MLTALAQAGDLVVVDLPRCLDEAATEALALANTTLMVVPAEVRASAAASQLAAGSGWSRRICGWWCGCRPPAGWNRST